LFFDSIFVIIGIFCLLGLVNIRYSGRPIAFACLDANSWVLRNGVFRVPPRNKWGDLNYQLGVFLVYQGKKKARWSEQNRCDAVL